MAWKIKGTKHSMKYGYTWFAEKLKGIEEQCQRKFSWCEKRCLQIQRAPNFYGELMENYMYLGKISKFNVRKIKFISF